MADVRAKVAQYFVDKKLRELESQDPHIKIDDWKFLQALPHFEPIGNETLQPADEPGNRMDEPTQLPPLSSATQRQPCLLEKPARAQ